MLPTYHQPSASLVKNNYGNIQKPICVKEYNNQIGDVDYVDQQLQSMQILSKTYK